MRCNDRRHMLCDVLLIVDELELPAHRAILAACSHYFYAMFTGDLSEAKAERIVLQQIDGGALSMLLDFMYTSEIQVTEDNVQVGVGTCGPAGVRYTSVSKGTRWNFFGKWLSCLSCLNI